MGLSQILRIRLRSLTRRETVEQELDEELRYHLERQIEEEMARGLSAEDARHAALRSIDRFEQRKEECRDMRGFNFIDNFAKDARYALRQLRKNPGFTCTAILMLALGLCASVAIFAFVDAALLKPLPYNNPRRLVGVYESVPPSCPNCELSYMDYLDWKQRNRVFRSLDVYVHIGLALTTSSGVEPSRGARVSDGFFRTLGVKPSLGRDFYSGEDSRASAPTVILSYAAWQERYGGKPDVLGRKVILNGEANTIIGVMPRDFHFAPAEPAEFWTALHAKSECDLRRSCHNLYGLARLKDGVSIQSALADVTRVAKQLEQEYPGSNREQGASVVPLTEVIVGDIRPVLLVLLSGAGLLLLIATVNVASLLLARSESRRREMAVRGALGAGRTRLIQQFLTEGLVLVSIGLSLGLVSAWWAMQLLTKLIPADMLAAMPYLHGLGLNVRVLAFAGAFSLLAAALFSVTPALHASMSKIHDGLAEGSRGSAGNTWRRLGSKLAVLELASAMVLLVGAGLLVRSLFLLLHVNIGMQPDHLATVYVVAPRLTYTNDAQTVRLQQQIIRRLTALPGVKSVGATSDIPVTHWGDTTWFRILGRPWHGEHNDTPERDVSSAYFEALGARIVSGRNFAESDDASKPRVAIINQALAKLHFPGEDPVGKQLSPLEDPPKPIQIVGVVEDIKEGQLDTTNRPALYFPSNQNANHNFHLVVRTTQAEASLLPSITAAIHKIDPGIVTVEPATMNQRLNNSMSAYMHRSSAWLVGAFAAMALILSVVGLYGVVAYSVSQRTREIGIRMALGAHRGSVYQLILREAGWLTALGVVIGLVLSLGAATLIRSLLFGVQPWDISTLVTVALVLGTSALLASFLPARRAARVNPIEALRAE
jgi:macrolide transport system ATP-binding/permease protein